MVGVVAQSVLVPGAETEGVGRGGVQVRHVEADEARDVIDARVQLQRAPAVGALLQVLQQELLPRPAVEAR